MKRIVFLLAIATLLAVPATGFAESPIYGNFGLKLGGYYPAIDQEFSGDAAPFQDVFGSQNLVIGEIEVDGYVWKGFGKFGFGLHAGFTKVKGDAMIEGGTASDDSAEGGEVTDTTTFSVVPLRASALYRYDYSAQHHGIPLVPVLKAGLDVYRWRIADSKGDTAEVDGERGAGWKSGWHVSLGLQLLLDVIDPGTAALFDVNWGVNNSFIFAEYLITKIDGFGAEGFNLSDDIWLFGLTFEF